MDRFQTHGMTRHQSKIMLNTCNNDAPFDLFRGSISMSTAKEAEEEMFVKTEEEVFVKTENDVDWS